MEQSDKDFLSAQFQAIRDHVDDKIHGLKTSIAVLNQQYRIDMEQRDEWHEKHFATEKEVTKIQATIYGVDGQNGLGRSVATLKESSHATPCKDISELKIVVTGEDGLVSRLKTHVDGHWKWVGIMATVITILGTIGGIVLKVWAK